MSEMDYSYEDGYEDEYYDDGRLSEEEIAEILEEYRRKQLIEHLIGPIVSTVVHIILIILMAIYLVFPAEEEEPEIEAEVVEEEVVELEEPEEVQEVEETEDVKTDSPTPDVTTPAVETEADDVSMEDVSDEVAETEDNLDMQEVSDVKIMDTALKTSTLFGGRTAKGRASAVAKYGGSKKSQDAVMRALMWLRDVQNPDGSWANSKQPAMTGLAVLTFLAHGETPSSKKFGKCVKKGITKLTEMMNSNKIPIAGHGVYEFAIATYALAEAYGMTGISDVGLAMDKGIARIIKGQQPGGSFVYGYANNRDDLSVAGWHYQALKAAYAAGSTVEGLKGAIDKSKACLKKSAANSFPYSGSNGGTQSMRGVGTLCMSLFGMRAEKNLQKQVDIILEKDLPNLVWDKKDLYAWYYSTQTMFHKGKGHWKAWNKKFQGVLIANQQKAGFWEWDGGTDKHHTNAAYSGRMNLLGKRVYATTLCALMLTVYYRYLPTFKLPKAIKANDNNAEGGEDVELKIE